MSLTRGTHRNGAMQWAVYIHITRTAELQQTEVSLKLHLVSV